MQSHDYLLSTLRNLEPIALHNFGSVLVEMVQYKEDLRFKQCDIIEFLTAEEIPPFDIHRCMQAVFVDTCIDASPIRRWIWQFKQEELREASLCYKERSGRPGRNSESC
jgi:hypothetical protein